MSDIPKVITTGYALEYWDEPDVKDRLLAVGAPGEYWVGDPCYLVPDHDNWLLVCDKLRASSRDDPEPAELTPPFDSAPTALAKVAFDTGVGDGVWPFIANGLHGLTGNLGVDAGMLCLFPMALERKWPEFFSTEGARFTGGPSKGNNLGVFVNAERGIKLYSRADPDGDRFIWADITGEM